MPSSAIKKTGKMANSPYSLTVYLIQEVIQGAENFKTKTLPTTYDKGSHFCFVLQFRLILIGQHLTYGSTNLVILLPAFLPNA